MGAEDMKVVRVEEKRFVWGGLPGHQIFIATYYLNLTMGGQISTSTETEKDPYFIASLVSQLSW